MSCLICDKPSSGYRSPLDGESRCYECASNEILGLIRDGSEPEDLKKLRRRIEERLRNDPSFFDDCAVMAIIENKIKWLDCV